MKKKEVVDFFDAKDGWVPSIVNIKLKKKKCNKSN